MIFVSIKLSYPELVVNVKTRSGQYTQQHLMADPEKDIVIIDFATPDGTKTKALIDFSKVIIFYCISLKHYCVRRYRWHIIVYIVYDIILVGGNCCWCYSSSI